MASLHMSKTPFSVQCTIHSCDVRVSLTATRQGQRMASTDIFAAQRPPTEPSRRVRPAWFAFLRNPPTYHVAFFFFLRTCTQASTVCLLPRPQHLPLNRASRWAYAYHDPCRIIFVSLKNNRCDIEDMCTYQVSYTRYRRNEGGSLGAINISAIHRGRTPQQHLTHLNNILRQPKTQMAPTPQFSTPDFYRNPCGT